MAWGVNSAEIDEKTKAEKDKSRTVAWAALLVEESMHIAWAWAIMHKHVGASNVVVWSEPRAWLKNKKVDTKSTFLRQCKH